MFWLTYQSLRGTEVFIAESGFFTMAKVKAGLAGQRGEFQEGHLLDDNTAKRIPTNMVGRTLSLIEAFAVL
jgi:hypothetical protein